MATYRKKPVEIEAVQFLYENFPEIAENWKEVKVDFKKTGPWEGYWYGTIKTLEGEMTASTNDWIIRGVQGEVYPCKPDIFEATYEKVD